MIESCHHNDDDDDKALGQLRFGNGDCDALPLVLPPVPGASWKIEILKKDMRLYSPSYKSQGQHMKNDISQYAIYCDLSFFLLCKVQARKSIKHDFTTVVTMMMAR